MRPATLIAAIENEARLGNTIELDASAAAALTDYISTLEAATRKRRRKR